MRSPSSFSAVLLLTLALALPPCAAQAGNGISFGGFSCRQRIPCDTASPSFPSAQQIIELGDSCVTQNTGLSSSSGFFVSMGLDASNCLVTNPSAFAQTADGAQSLPHCCVVPTPGGGDQCMMFCDMVSR